MNRFVIPSLFLCAAAFAAPATVTFHKDVEPILQRACQECHRAGEIGPMPLLTYDQARPYAKAIKSDVLQKKMPPWPADPHYLKFENDRSLSPAEIETISAWVDSGAKEGSKSDAPAPRKFIDGWNMEKPDLVIKMPVAFDVPAKEEIEYQYIMIPSGFTEDKWIQGVEVRPSDRTVVHHAVIYLQGLKLEMDGGRETWRAVRAAEPDPRIEIRERPRRYQRRADRVHARHGS